MKKKTLRMPYKGTTPYNLPEVAEKYAKCLVAKLGYADEFFLSNFWLRAWVMKGLYVDLGCGIGYLTSRFAGMISGNGRVVGVEPSDYFYKRARENTGENCSFLHEKGSRMIGKLGIEKNSVNGIMSIQVFLNINERTEVEKTIKAIAQVLKPGGIFFMTSTNPEAIAAQAKTKTIKVSTPANFSLTKIGGRFRTSRLLVDGSWIEQANRYWPRAWLVSEFKKHNMHLEEELVPVPSRLKIKKNPELESGYAEFVSYVFRKNG